MIGTLVTLAVLVGALLYLCWKFPKVRIAAIGIATAIGAGAYAFWESIAPLLGLG